jgi:hypothetical protein
MVEVITYSLRDGRKRSEQYYQDIAAFTDEVLAEAQGRAGVMVKAFQAYLQQTGREAPRSYAEYAFELLTLGVLWRVYAGEAIGLARTPQRLLAGLAQLRVQVWRQQNGCLKSGIDFWRGVLATLFLFRRHASQTPPPTFDNLDQLLNWLTAASDFKEEVKRLSAWRDFLADQNPSDVNEHLNTAIAFAAWFEARSQAALGRYTPHVEQFLAETHPGYRWREDVIFCGRQRVEYHLNMVGTEILNRAFREKFLKTDRKIVLLPPCMTAQPRNQCEARSTPFGSRCAGCTPGCRVHQVTKLGEKRGFEVLIMPHELSVFSNKQMQPTMDSTVGIVGVSCPLTNVTGGWETKDMGLPAQSVLLDYCGCPWHWHREGIPTDINLYQLLRVLELSS